MRAFLRRWRLRRALVDAIEGVRTANDDGHANLSKIRFAALVADLKSGIYDDLAL